MFRRPHPFPLHPDTSHDSNPAPHSHDNNALGTTPQHPFQTSHSALQTVPENLMQDHDAGMQRLAKMEAEDHKRRLIRDVKALAKLRGITQAQMATELGVPRRTLEEWLQFRRYPRGPGTTLLERWFAEHQGND